MIRKVEIRTPNVHDVARLEAVLPPELGEVYGDSAFASAGSDRLILARGGTLLSVQTGVWDGLETLARLKIHNAVVRKVRLSDQEGVWHVQAWFGLVKADLHVRLTAIAYNLRRSRRLLAPACA